MNDEYAAYKAEKEEAHRHRERAHKELSKYRECQKCLERQQEKIVRLESRINAVVKPLKNPDECPSVQKQGDPKAIEDLLVNAAELRKIYDRTAAYSEGRLRRIERLVLTSGLSEAQAEVIDRLYILGDRAPRRKEVAARMNYGRTQLFNLTNSALEKIGKRVNTSEHIDSV